MPILYCNYNNTIPDVNLNAAARRAQEPKVPPRDRSNRLLDAPAIGRNFSPSAEINRHKRHRYSVDKRMSKNAGGQVTA
jgi:hypothetical protein